MTTVAATTSHYLEQDDDAVDVRYGADVVKDQLAYVDGFLGITNQAGTSDGYGSLTVDDRAYQFSVPSTLSVSKGDTVWIDITDLTGHTPNDSAYYTSTGSNRIRLFRAIEDKDSNNVVSGFLMSRLGLS